MFKLRLQNYRGFVDEEFDFSRVNILIGENSAGKSSILKFLLALRQSFRTPNNREYNFTFSGVDTDLGSYQEAIYNHEIERNFTFSFNFKDDYTNYFWNFFAPIRSPKNDVSEGLNDPSITRRNEILGYLGGEIIDSTTITFTLSNDLSNHKNISTRIFNDSLGELEIFHPETEIQAGQDIYIIGETPECSINFHSKEADKTIHLQNIQFQKEAFLSIIVGDSLMEKLKEQLGDGAFKAYYQIAFLLITQNYVSFEVSGIEYINPLISKPAERIYLQGDTKNTRRIGDIKELIDLLSTSTMRPKFKEDLENILSDLGIADEIRLRKDGYIRELRIVLDGIENNIKDVGFGVSLQLPIFAQALLSETSKRTVNSIQVRKGDTLLIEQPEAHLHPKLQAKFINSLLKIGENNVYFIETHSEHIVRMLQILVKEERYKIKSQDISIHYLRKEGKEVIKSQHKIDSKTGKLKPNFPEGFNDVSYELAFQLMD